GLSEASEERAVVAAHAMRGGEPEVFVVVLGDRRHAQRREPVGEAEGLPAAPRGPRAEQCNEARAQREDACRRGEATRHPVRWGPGAAQETSRRMDRFSSAASMS